MQKDLTNQIQELEKSNKALLLKLEKVEKEKQEAEKNRQRAEYLDQIKSEFLSIAAHQLRTPLSGIKWMLKLMLNNQMGKLSLEQKKFLFQADQTNDRLIRLVNELLDVSRIEQGRFGFKFVKADFLELVQESKEVFIPLIKEKNIKLVLIKPEKPLPLVKLDRKRIIIVLRNLMENAIVYAPRESTIRVEILKQDKNIKFIIKDFGTGIPKKEQKRVFSKFFRGSNVIRLDTEGTGLGLFISRNIINAHKGKIGFKSKHGRGSCFWFSLPLD